MTTPTVDDLPNEDPRFYAIQKRGAGSASIAVTQKYLKTLASFGLPSNPSLCLSIANKAHPLSSNADDADLFKNTDQGLRANDHTPLFDVFEAKIMNIVFSFTALESFANISIPDNFKFMHIDRKGGPAIPFDKEMIERNLSLDVKLDKILPTIFKVKTPKGTALWQKYKTLKKLRDRLIHLKSQDTKSGGPESKTIWGELMKYRDYNFANDAHQLIGHYFVKTHKPRWFRLYPYPYK